MLHALVHPLNDRAARHTRRRGFTLLEVIVVVTIIALLAAFIAPRLLGNVSNTKQSLAESEVKSIASQVAIWMANNGADVLPDDFELELLTEGQDRVLNAEDIMDPWDNPYAIENPGSKNVDFDVISSGPDGEFGTEDDIVN